MKSLQYRSYQKELLDRDDIPFRDIQENMRELNIINTLLGGHAITLKGFQKLAAGQQQIIVCEIGCGGGDNLAAIAKWCKKKHLPVKFIGLDLKEECINVAREVGILRSDSEWIVSDYAEVIFEQKPDIIFSSLFCHHFNEPQLVEQLQWMKNNSNIGFFINDLHRNMIAYYAIRVLTGLFSSSYLVKHDAPLSVARGFRRQEWDALFKRAMPKQPVIRWLWAFRYLIIYKNES